MHIFITLALIEIYIIILPEDLPGNISAAILVALTLCIFPSVLHDTRSGFIPMIGYALSVGWYLAAIPRLLPGLNRVYESIQSAEIALIFAFMTLIAAPMALLAGPMIPASRYVYYRYRSRRRR